jgi:glycerophosphoryl diester phosphodiesterase
MMPAMILQNITRSWVVGLLLVVVAGGVTNAAEPQPAVLTRAAWNVRDHIPLSEITVQSHRGAGKLAPENTIEAFQLAWKLNTVPEADLRTTKDGVVVAFHDSNFKRLVKDASPELKEKCVGDLTWDNLRTLDVGSWMDEKFVGCRIPSMAQILGLLVDQPKRRLYLDIKEVDLQKLANDILTAGVDQQIIVASTDYAFIRHWKQLAPKSGTLHWMGGTEKTLAARLADLRKTNFADITQLQIHVRTVESDQAKSFTPSNSFLIKTGEELRRHGILFQTLPWGRSDALVYRELMDLGVASFATDYPEVTMQVIRDYYAERR